jgi:hypothetical protein
MAIAYPDVLGDLVDARQRFEADGVQYVQRLVPPVIAQGATAHLHFWLQSCWEAGATLRVATMWSRGLALRMPEPSLDVPLRAAEVAELLLPIQAGPDLPPGTHRLSLRLRARPEVRCQRIRPRQATGALENSLLPYVVGLRLASSLGVGYSTTPRTQFDMPLRVVSPSEQASVGTAGGEGDELAPTLVSRWVLDDWPTQGRAQQWVNDRRPYILKGLELPSLFRVLMDETQERFRRSGLQLAIGETIFVAKILAWTVRYFLDEPSWQDGLLVPAYALAFQHDLPTDDPTLLVARADYARLVRLASALTFGLLRRRRGEDIWDMGEQRALAEFVSGRLESAKPLSAEFLYLPLVVGGLLVGEEVVLPGEKYAESRSLVAVAREGRQPEWADNAGLTALLDDLLA